MENQKKKSKSSSGFSNFNFSIGLVVSLILVICAFEWKTPVSPISIPEPGERADPYSGIVVIDLPEKKVEVPKPPVPTIQKKVILENANVIESEDEIEDLISPLPIDDRPIIDIDDFAPPVEKTEEVPFSNPEQRAEFDYRGLNFSQYIGTKFRVPSRSNGISGTVFIEFVIDKDGSLIDVKIVKGLTAEIDAEALRVVKNSPKWTPARQGGRLVKMKMVLPIIIWTE